MDPRLASIYLIFKELGGFRNADLEDRVFMQKAVYLIQLLGVDLRFRFSWYLRGPYSRELAQSVYDIDADSQLRQAADKLQPRQEVIPVLDKLREWLQHKPASIAEKSRWFELLSSIHFVKHISEPQASIDKATIGDYLRKADKVNFSEPEIEDAWGILESVGLIESKQRDLKSPAQSTA